ncbi:MAG: tRNA (adenosine(37)-N6)-threonylcarbamoyltransferase complex ATPase subunit type 1 TsaE [Cytophagaceae bacterium]|nr:tRNA (adenosine(37)-N6)-threonylcarbamoyltransferase complex ATPase subunit type 1 TsaE [Cytophagaceae bacterium]|tara:strand:+ start:1800 stop:2207 length:408 start_codon:yes stop_codon:yes gene_type:complete
MNATYALSHIDDIAQKVIDNSSHKVILFSGPMGAGKTTLIKSMVRYLGYDGEVSSPTFSLVNEYCTNVGELIFHFDFYRINDPNEALDIGFDEYLDQNGWVFIEWPEKINNLLPENYHSANIKSINEKERLLEFC